MENELKISDKYALTVEEAAKYFNIGEKKLRWIINEYSDEMFYLSIGTKILIKKELFSKFLDEISSL